MFLGGGNMSELAVNNENIGEVQTLINKIKNTHNVYFFIAQASNQQLLELNKQYDKYYYEYHLL